MSDTKGNGRKLMAFAGIAIINFMTMYLIAGAGIYAYNIAGAFDAVASVSIIFTLESVGRCVMMPLSGKIADHFGLKRVFLFAVIIYTVFTALSAFATGFWMFAIAHMITGFAWGLFMSNILAMIPHIFGTETAPKYAGIAQSLATVAMIISSPLAGIFCAFNWRLEFAIAIPILIVGFVLCAVAIPNIPKSESEGGRMDIGGCVGTIMALMPFCLAMNFGNSLGWTSPIILGMIALLVVGLIILVVVERKATEPIYPAKLLTNRYYLSIFMISLLFAIISSVSNYIPAYSQSVLGASSTVAGMITVPSLIIASILTVTLGNIVAKTGKYKKIVIFWTVCVLITGVLFLFVNPMQANGSTFTLIFVIAAVTPLGAMNGVQQFVPYTYPMKVLKPQEIAGGMAFMGLGGSLGGTIANGVIGALMNAVGFGSIFYVPLVCGIVMLIFTFIFKDIKQGESI